MSHRDRANDAALTHRLAAVFETNIEALVDAWWSLGSDGPTCAAPDAGDDEFSKERYLRPLARLLIGALRGSADHEAVYADERLRYLPPELDPAGRRRFVGARFEREVRALTDVARAEVPVDVAAVALQRLHTNLVKAPAGEALRVLLVGDCIFNDMRAFLSHQTVASEQRLDVDHIYFSTTVDKAISSADVAAAVRRGRPHLIALSLFTFQGLPLYTALLADAWKLSHAEIERRALVLVDLLRETVDAVRGVTDATLALHTVCGLPLDRVRRRVPVLPPQSRRRQIVCGVLSRLIRELADETDNAVVVDESTLVETGGGYRLCARSVFDEDDVPDAVFHPTAFGPVLADFYGGLLSAYRTFGRAKCLLVDFDNTLWTGVMADGEVVHNRGGQRLLRQLREAGVLLVALSKNDPGAIRWDEMELAPDDFVLHKINWRPKPDTVSEVIHQLDLSADAFVLLDDNPVERALVTERVAGVAAVDSLSPATWRALEYWLAFPSTKQTEEARQRTQMYQEAAERRTAMAVTHDYAEMMASLKLKASLRRAEASDMERLLELVQRTSQFNTTTIRRSADDIAGLLLSERHAVYVSSLRDRFGALGVVGVVILERDDDTVLFDSVIMSCRAMGFGLEQFLVARSIANEPAVRYVGRVVATDRNGPARNLFELTGFHEAEPGTWVLDASDDRPTVPAWLA